MKKEAMFYRKLDGGKVECYLCAHNCNIADSGFGICGVRQNIGGSLYTLCYGEAIAAHIDPIEKKPLYHFLPSSNSYSIATIGCNFKCGFCQNWQISQSTKKEHPLYKNKEFMPEDIVKEARENNCRSIAYTYTEPTIFFEYAYDTAKLAKEAGIYNVFVTNGYMSRDALDAISPYLDAANVDLKSFRDGFYKRICKAHISPVLDSIRYMKKLGIWVEVTTLIVPGENDSEEELKDIARFIAGVDENIPWHISRFHPDYEFTQYSSTPLEVLRRAENVGKSAGLRYIYLGNAAQETNTYCYNCGNPLVKRMYFSVLENNIRRGKCLYCGADIAGLWE
ncbi:MAG: AmmeMemoRadiSam system radical SAM enzyme [Candidatus Omnitrophica bacterium 4484_171]|nr:MAG: AmmeMemoRadiSam system radical SAM enzyme [Candidatus Omnitrophica bacterium 4484_171]